MTPRREVPPLGVADASAALQLLVRGLPGECRIPVALRLLETLRRRGSPPAWMGEVEESLRRGEWPPVPPASDSGG